ncbi:hypothetical protein [Limnohabitans sp. 2KL-17]|uniref:hypothetical protein n=1 Tax=Limnohabitans sp. 2KL-17 TaxID=1100704 RepID=UPI0011B2137B|nr:hypothetical protein [Limnohabitans sp. 2KL-17]
MNLEKFDADADQRWFLSGLLVCSCFAHRISFTANIFHNLKNTNAASPHFSQYGKMDIAL